MGSPLGPTFANYYMGNLEEKVLTEMIEKPNIYVRYVDDCFLEVKSEAQLIKIKTLYEENSVLAFTYEMNVESRLPFLDVMVRSTGKEFQTTVFHKPTNHGHCLNANSECIDRYKDGVIKCYLSRAFKITRNSSDFNKELQYIKQMLVNNNYPNSRIDSLTREFLRKKKVSPTNAQVDEPKPISIYYNNQMHKNYKTEERVLREIINNNVTCLENKLNLIFYYKNQKSCNLVMKNNMADKVSSMRSTNVIYDFECPVPNCKSERYIGMTQTTLFRRLGYHLNSGSIFKHFAANHNCKPSRELLENNTKIIARADNRYRLAIKEAILILEHSPSINKQFDNFVHVLKLHSHRGYKPTNSNNLPLNNPSHIDDKPTESLDKKATDLTSLPPPSHVKNPNPPHNPPTYDPPLIKNMQDNPVSDPLAN